MYGCTCLRPDVSPPAFQRPCNDPAGPVPQLNSYCQKAYLKPTDTSIRSRDNLFHTALQHARQVAFATVPFLADVLPQRMTDDEYKQYLARREEAIAGLQGLNHIYEDVCKLRYLHWYKQFDKNAIWSKISLLPIKKFGETVLPADELEAVKLLKECSANYGVVKQAVSNFSPPLFSGVPYILVRFLKEFGTRLSRQGPRSWFLPWN